MKTYCHSNPCETPSANTDVKNSQRVNKDYNNGKLNRGTSNWTVMTSRNKNTKKHLPWGIHYPHQYSLLRLYE